MIKLPDPDLGLELDVHAVKSLLPQVESGEVFLIDCREADEFDYNRLAGARLVTLSGFPAAASPIVHSGRPCIVYCHHGIRSLHATQLIRSMGLHQAWSMTGGIDKWSQVIDPSIPRY